MFQSNFKYIHDLQNNTAYFLKPIDFGFNYGVIFVNIFILLPSFSSMKVNFIFAKSLQLSDSLQRRGL